MLTSERSIPTSERLMPRKQKLPPHVRRVVVKGRTFYYYQKFRNTDRAEKPVRLPDDLHSPEWWDAYAAAAKAVIPLPRADTVGLLIDAYRNPATPEWKKLSRRTKGEWSRYLDRVREHWGGLEVRGLEAKHILALRNKYADTPAAANNLLRALSSMLKWSIPHGWRNDNPCAHVKKLEAGDGYPPWSRRELAFFSKHARPDLWHAAALALYTGQRQGDVLVMRRSGIENGKILVQQQKTKKQMLIPLHPELQAILDEMPKRSLHLLTSTLGTPWTQEGFRASWQAEMDRRIFKPLRQRRLVFHGLRKSAVCFLLEAGCTDAEVAAITGHSRKMLELYAAKVNQEKLATAAILKWHQSDERTKNEPST